MPHSPPLFKSISINDVPTLNQENIYLQSRFTLPQSSTKFVLTFTDKFIIWSETCLLQSTKYFTCYCFDLAFEIVYDVENKINSKKIGFRLLYNMKKMIQFEAEDTFIMNQVQLFLKRKINQRGFHEQFKPIKKIGKGNFASVFKVERILDTKKFAVKAFSKINTYNTQDGKASLEIQLSILRKINYKNIMYLEGVYQSENSIYIVLELIQGCQLYQILTNNQTKNWSIDETKGLMKGILSGLHYLHKKRIMHRDLKPENIILRNNDWSSPILVDFGLATNCDEEKYIFNRCGTPGFVSPEIINQKKPEHIEPVCDLFSLGVLFHILLTKKPVFEGYTYKQVLGKNKKLDMRILQKEIKKISPEALDLLKQMLQTNPEKRITAKQALNHQFLKEENQQASFQTNDNQN